MVHSKATLQLAGDCAAMLRGGILSHIAQQFLSIDGVLEGPSVEITEHCTGFVTRSKHCGYSYWDDELTENEIAIIIGTYSMYTGKHFVVNAFTLTDFWWQVTVFRQLSCPGFHHPLCGKVTTVATGG